MPIVAARSASKNMSKSKRNANHKNKIRIEAALKDELTCCSYGKVTKALGNKMFIIVDAKNIQYLAHIRGKLTRVSIGNIVLLNIREYESRSTTEKAVFDIMAVFSDTDASHLVKSGAIPKWMTSKDETTDDLFDYGGNDTDSNDEIKIDNI
jgi:translation initiation factor IF-1